MFNFRVHLLNYYETYLFGSSSQRRYRYYTLASRGIGSLTGILPQPPPTYVQKILKHRARSFRLQDRYAACIEAYTSTYNSTHLHNRTK